MIKQRRRRWANWLDQEGCLLQDFFPRRQRHVDLHRSLLRCPERKRRPVEDPAQSGASPGRYGWAKRPDKIRRKGQQTPPFPVLWTDAIRNHSNVAGRFQLFIGNHCLPGALRWRRNSIGVDRDRGGRQLSNRHRSHLPFGDCERYCGGTRNVDDRYTSTSPSRPYLIITKRSCTMLWLANMVSSFSIDFVTAFIPSMVSLATSRRATPKAGSAAPSYRSTVNSQ